jgi:hypothetical protein
MTAPAGTTATGLTELAVRGQDRRRSGQHDSLGPEPQPVPCADGFELDEALLGGEAEPVRKQPGDQVLSGSAVVAGSAPILAVCAGVILAAVAALAGWRRWREPGERLS